MKKFFILFLGLILGTLLLGCNQINVPDDNSQSNPDNEIELPEDDDSITKKKTTRYSGDGQIQRITIEGYNSKKLLVYSIEKNPDGSVNYTTSYEYDDLDREIKKTVSSQYQTTTYTTEYEISNDGLDKKSTTYVDGELSYYDIQKTKKFIYDGYEFTQTVESTYFYAFDGVKQTTTYEYDEDGQTKKMCNYKDDILVDYAIYDDKEITGYYASGNKRFYEIYESNWYEEEHKSTFWSKVTYYNEDGSVDYYSTSESEYTDSFNWYKSVSYNADGTLQSSYYSEFNYDEGKSKTISEWNNEYGSYGYSVVTEDNKTTYYNGDGSIDYYEITETL